jgi:hypothetical protein
MEREIRQDLTVEAYSGADTSGSSNRLRDAAFHPAESTAAKNGVCRLPQAFNTSFVPDIIESYTRCRQEGGVLENTLDEIYWNLRHEKNFGTEEFKKVIEGRFASAHMHNSRELDLVLTALNFGIKLMKKQMPNEFGLNWYKKTDAATGAQQLHIDLLDNSKGGKILDSLAADLPKSDK